ncbi:MAG: uridine diphosphate-N-acetylglucosamine-binding protein YvcK [Actinomycetales bacterium]|nr:uridine diphosphate-N-acetylglucosamine-binding protein YvcK [Actinomycetales bacterium]MCP4892721.1 uridine diphosphate-N-acetylglucosamine-binding protein YvcK [Actinomycetales bacterium]
MGEANTTHSGQPLVAALGGGHGLAVSLRALHRLTHRVTAIVGVADDGGSSGRLRQERGILPPGDIRMALAALCDADAQTRPWVDVLQFRFSDGGELSGHALGNLLLSAVWEKTSDPVAGLDELVGLLGCSGRVLPCCVDPLEIAASIRGHDGQHPEEVSDVRGQVEVATTRGRVLQVRVEPPEAKACPQAVAAIDAADVITVGPGSWFTSVMPHLVVPEIADAVADSSATRVLVLNLVEQEGETGGFTPAEHVEALKRHAPQVAFDHVIADSTHIREGAGRDDVVSACASWGSEVTFADVSATGDRHDPGKLARVFDTVLVR